MRLVQTVPKRTGRAGRLRDNLRMFSPSQADVRRFFCAVYDKQRLQQPMEAIEMIAAQWMAEHPEHHADFADADAALQKMYDAEDGKNVSIAFTRKKPGYIVVTLEYQRYEGEKKIFRQFRSKKELVFREIDPKNLFNYNNVEQVPITKICSNKNDKSKFCCNS